MVGNKGLEPLRYRHQSLNLACLPIPPIPHVRRPSSAFRTFLHNDSHRCLPTFVPSCTTTKRRIISFLFYKLLTNSLATQEGFEPSRYCYQRLLRPSCMPFHHQALLICRSIFLIIFLLSFPLELSLALRIFSSSILFIFQRLLTYILVCIR